jgi:hypothetical protein
VKQLDEATGPRFQRLIARGLKACGRHVSRSYNGQSSKTPGVDEADFPTRSQAGDCVGMFGDLNVGRGDLHLTRHAEMNDPLSFLSMLSMCLLQIEDNVFADTANSQDFRVLQDLRYLSRR